MSERGNLIFGEMVSSDFYPEHRDDNLIEVTIAAPSNSELYPGDVVIIDKSRYEALRDRVVNLKSQVSINLQLIEQVEEKNRRIAELEEAVQEWILYMDEKGYSDKQYRKGILKQALKKENEL